MLWRNVILSHLDFRLLTCRAVRGSVSIVQVVRKPTAMVTLQFQRLLMGDVNLGSVTKEVQDTSPQYGLLALKETAGARSPLLDFLLSL